jgi:flagellin
MTFQVGAFAGQTVDLGLNGIAANQMGATAVDLSGSGATTIAGINVTTSTGANDALKLIDAAISEVSTVRANLGAFQKNILESNVNSLSIAKENIAASESSIRDTDMAAEMVNFTKSQILEQAGVSMLAQANQAPQSLLKLLQ